MSVFTTLTLQEVQDWLQDYDLGVITDLKGIAAGITNTNYFVITESKRFVLTVFEKNTMQELPYFVHLMTHLAQHKVLCPTPIMNKNGESLHLLKGKPALLVSCLKGKGVEASTVNQCAEVGAALAKMHIAGQAFKKSNTNQRNDAWFADTASLVMDKLNTKDQNLLSQALVFKSKLDLDALPGGVIHADLFCDNVLFDGEELGGFIDFYYACNGVFAYDVAIAVNDWCLLDNGVFDDPKLNAFMLAYTEIRPFDNAEQNVWQGLLCIAALRFWLSRLHDWHFPQEGELTHAKDPEHFKQILLKRAS